MALAFVQGHKNKRDMKYSTQIFIIIVNKCFKKLSRDPDELRYVVKFEIFGTYQEGELDSHFFHTDIIQWRFYTLL